MGPKEKDQANLCSVRKIYIFYDSIGNLYRMYMNSELNKIFTVSFSPLNPPSLSSILPYSLGERIPRLQETSAQFSEHAWAVMKPSRGLQPLDHEKLGKTVFQLVEIWKGRDEGMLKMAVGRIVRLQLRNDNKSRIRNCAPHFLSSFSNDTERYE